MWINCTGVNKAVNASIWRKTYNEATGTFEWVQLVQDKEKRKDLEIFTNVNVNATAPTISLKIITPTSFDDDGEYECRFFTATTPETNRTSIYGMLVFLVNQTDFVSIFLILVAVPASRLCIAPDNDPTDKIPCRSPAYPVDLNSNVTITCRLGGFPLPTVQWYRGHIPANLEKEIKESSKADSTKSDVQVQMQTSSSVSPLASVTTAPLTAASNATVLDKNGFQTQRAQGTYKFAVYKNVPNAVLILEGVTLADRNKYICVVKNEYGTRSSEINLHIHSTHYVPRASRSPRLVPAPDVFSMHRSIALLCRGSPLKRHSETVSFFHFSLIFSVSRACAYVC